MGGVLLYWLRTCIGYSSGKAFDDFGTFFNADDSAIQRNMVVGGIAPFHIGVEAVIGGTALIFFLQSGFGRFLPLPIDLHDAVSTELHVCVDIDLQAVGAVLQNKIGAASHDDAGLFFRQLPDDPVLQLPEQVLVGGAKAAVGEGRGEEAAGSVFSGLLDVVFVKAAFGSQFLDQFGVVAMPRCSATSLPMVLPPLPNSRLMVMIRFSIRLLLSCSVHGRS